MHQLNFIYLTPLLLYLLPCQATIEIANKVGNNFFASFQTHYFLKNSQVPKKIIVSHQYSNPRILPIQVTRTYSDNRTPELFSLRIVKDGEVDKAVNDSSNEQQIQNLYLVQNENISEKKPRMIGRAKEKTSLGIFYQKNGISSQTEILIGIIGQNDEEITNPYPQIESIPKEIFGWVCSREYMEKEIDSFLGGAFRMSLWVYIQHYLYKKKLDKVIATATVYKKNIKSNQAMNSLFEKKQRTKEDLNIYQVLIKKIAEKQTITLPQKFDIPPNLKRPSQTQSNYRWGALPITLLLLSLLAHHFFIKKKKRSRSRRGKVKKSSSKTLFLQKILTPFTLWKPTYSFSDTSSKMALHKMIVPILAP